jgi:hypothetical protein
MTDHCPLRVRVGRSLGLALVTAFTLAACGGTSSPQRTAPTSAASTVPTGGSSTVAPTPTTTPATNPGIIQGVDNNSNPYGNFKVAVKVAPHLENVDFAGSPYAPETPLQPDGTCSAGQFQGGICDPAGYKYIHFTLTFTNPTTTPEVFGTVGFSSVLKPMAYLAAPSSDGGMTPASAKFGGPTNGLEPVTKQNVTAWWESGRDGPGDLFRFPEPFAQSHFLFNLNPSGKYADRLGPPVIPNVLKPGQSFDIEYISDAVAPTAPLGDLTLWVGYNPQQLPTA